MIRFRCLRPPPGDSGVDKWEEITRFISLLVAKAIVPCDPHNEIRTQE